MSAHILIVHDEPKRREQLRLALEPAHTVSLAGGVHDSILLLKDIENKVIAGSPVDLILSAVHMDSNDALTVFDLLKWARGNLQLRHIPFVLVDVEPSKPAKTVRDAIRSAASSLGATAYLIFEQLDGAELLTKLNTYIQPDLRIELLAAEIERECAA